MIAQVAEGIMQQFNQSAALKNGLTNGLHFQRAPEFTSGSYSVFTIVTVVNDEIMGGVDDVIVNVDIQFNLFTDADDGGYDISFLTDALATAFDWQQFIIAGYSVIKMQKENVLPLGIVDEVWQTAVNYQLSIQKI